MIFIIVALIIIQAATVAAFILLGERRDERHAAQVRELCQRIQAPEIATTEAIDGPASLGFVAPDDDAGFWENQMVAS